MVNIIKHIEELVQNNKNQNKRIYFISMLIGNRGFLSNSENQANSLQPDAIKQIGKQKNPKLKENMPKTDQYILQSIKKVANQQNSLMMSHDIAVQGWGSDEIDQQVPFRFQQEGVLQQKFLNYSLNPSNKKKNSINQNKSMSWIDQQRKSMQSQIKNKTENHPSTSKGPSCRKRRCNYSCEKRKKSVMTIEEEQSYQNVFTEGYNGEQANQPSSEQFAFSNISILKTHAKHLESEEFVRESSYLCRKQKKGIKQRDAKKNHNEDLIQFQNLKNNLFITSGNLSAKHSAFRSHSSHPQNRRATFYNSKYSSNSNAFSVYKRVQEELVRRTVYDNLKINGTQKDKMMVGTKRETQNSFKISVEPIHNSNINKIPFQKFFNRKRNKCRNIKEPKKIEEPKSHQENHNIQRIQGTKLNRILSHTHSHNGC